MSPSHLPALGRGEEEKKEESFRTSNGKGKKAFLHKMSGDE